MKVLEKKTMMNGRAYAHLIPMPATFWKPEAKRTYKAFRDAVVAFVDDPREELLQSVSCTLVACAHVECWDDLLLLTSMMQVKNVVRSLASLPDGAGWKFIKNAITEVEDVFNKQNCTNARVCAILKECGMEDCKSTIHLTWKARQIAGQAFWVDEKE
jgi:hypothetical protein